MQEAFLSDPDDPALAERAELVYGTARELYVRDETVQANVSAHLVDEVAYVVLQADRLDAGWSPAVTGVEVNVVEAREPHP